MLIVGVILIIKEKKDVRVFKVVNPEKEKEKDMLSFLSVGIVFDKLRINLI